MLYIYHRIKQELIARGNDQKNLLMSVLQRSNDICAKVCCVIENFVAHVCITDSDNEYEYSLTSLIYLCRKNMKRVIAFITNLELRII